VNKFCYLDDMLRIVMLVQL